MHQPLTPAVPPDPPGLGTIFHSAQKQTPTRGCGWGFGDKDPGDDLLSHGLSHTTIGAGAFHFRVRNGIGWFHTAMVTRERVEGRFSAPASRLIPTGIAT